MKPFNSKSSTNANLKQIQANTSSRLWAGYLIIIRWIWCADYLRPSEHRSPLCHQSLDGLLSNTVCQETLTHAKLNSWLSSRMCHHGLCRLLVDSLLIGPLCHHWWSNAILYGLVHGSLSRRQMVEGLWLWDRSNLHGLLTLLHGNLQRNNAQSVVGRFRSCWGSNIVFIKYLMKQKMLWLAEK